jgi:hypothetical protein
LNSQLDELDQTLNAADHEVAEVRLKFTKLSQGIALAALQDFASGIARLAKENGSVLPFWRSFS